MNDDIRQLLPEFIAELERQQQPQQDPTPEEQER